MNTSTPIRSSVLELVSIAAPVSRPNTTRVRPVELNTYVVDATLTDYRFTEDSDYHVVITDSVGRTMIVELAHPDCVASTGIFRNAIISARESFNSRLRATSSYKTASVPVRIYGIGFFDSIHGQRGVAANGIELHPVLKIEFDLPPNTPVTGESSQTSLVFSTGWQLVGNSVNAPISVATSFSDATKVLSIWKWVSAGNASDVAYPNWAFYSPSQSDGGQAYASSKGYEYLTTINGGDGFWVNAKTNFTALLPAGTAVTTSSFQNKPSGWHLISIGETKTPTGFSIDMSATPPATEALPQNITSLWAWDSAQSKWYFHAPSLQAQGGTALTDYITSKRYLDFTLEGKALGPGTGFWVNKP